MAVRVDERIVAGEAGDPVVVHHLVLRGPNRSIGRHLGEIVRDRYRAEPPPAAEPLRVRAQREWLRCNAPVLLERARGVADAFRVDLESHGGDPTRLGLPVPPVGCSAVFVPPRLTAAGRPLVSRAFDHPAPPPRPAPGAPPGAGRPYVLELHPDAGHPSLALVAFDLLGAALDGVNAEGLVVVAAGDAEAGALEPDPAGVGLDELQLGRVLLETCADAAEARALLLATKQRYVAAPVHWLVADRHGDAFVFEVGPGRNRVHLLEAGGLPLVRTNHPLHRYPGDAGLPREEGPARSYARYRALRSALLESATPWSPATLSLAAERAFARPDTPAGERTLWHGIYDPRERTLEASFYRYDEPDPALPGALRSVRTAPLRFRLSA